MRLAREVHQDWPSEQQQVPTQQPFCAHLRPLQMPTSLMLSEIISRFIKPISIWVLVRINDDEQSTEPSSNMQITPAGSESVIQGTRGKTLVGRAWEGCSPQSPSLLTKLIRTSRTCEEHQVHRGSDSMFSCRSPLTCIATIFSITGNEMEILSYG